MNVWKKYYHFKCLRVGLVIDGITLDRIASIVAVFLDRCHFLSIEYSVVVLGDSSLSGKIVGYVAGRKEIAPSDRSTLPRQCRI